MKTIEDFLVSLEEYQEAKQDLDKCYESCNSSPGYHCWHYADRERKARKSLGDCLQQIIDERVQFALSK